MYDKAIFALRQSDPKYLDAEGLKNLLIKQRKQYPKVNLKKAAHRLFGEGVNAMTVFKNLDNAAFWQKYGLLDKRAATRTAIQNIFLAETKKDPGWQIEDLHEFLVSQDASKKKLPMGDVEKVLQIIEWDDLATVQGGIVKTRKWYPAEQVS